MAQDAKGLTHTTLLLQGEGEGKGSVPHWLPLTQEEGEADYQLTHFLLPSSASLLPGQSGSSVCHCTLPTLSWQGHQSTACFCQVEKESPLFLEDTIQ